jgi:hypothetical protein
LRKQSRRQVGVQHFHVSLSSCDAIVTILEQDLCGLGAFCRSFRMNDRRLVSRSVGLSVETLIRGLQSAVELWRISFPIRGLFISFHFQVLRPVPIES